MKLHNTIITDRAAFSRNYSWIVTVTGTHESLTVDLTVVTSACYTAVGFPRTAARM